MTDVSNQQPERFDLNSDDVAARKRADLRRLFPEVFNEDSIDFDQLRRVMGDWVDEGSERFGLRWPGKTNCMKVIQAPATGALRPDRDESVNFDETTNVFIEGDNLEVLKLLQKAYFGKIKMIYIDPPYNTGKEFIYPDKYDENLATYLAYTGQADLAGRSFSTNPETAGRFHSRWLSMMYPRLYIARHLLREDGVFFMSVDDGELGNARAMLDQVFGSNNRLDRGTLIWPNKGSTKGFQKIVKNHEYILAYGKNAEAVTSLFHLNNEMNDLIDERLQIKRSPRNPLARVKFPAGLRYEGTGDKRIEGPISPGTNQIDIVEGELSFSDGKLNNDVVLEAAFPYRNQMERFFSSQETGETVTDAKGQIWREVYFTNTGVPYYTKKRSYRVISSLIENAKNSGSADLEKLDLDGSFDNPKPVSLIENFVNYFTTGNDLILDFFAGSSTTADAVLTRNHIDGHERRFIMVQLPEVVEDNEEYGDIAQISRKRIRRAIKRIAATQDDGSERPAGFRAFSLSGSAFATWDASTEDGAVDLIDKLEKHALSVRDVENEAILFELLLKDGFELTTPIEQFSVGDGAVYGIADSALLICLERKLTKEIIDAIADLAEKKDTARVVCLDAGFQGNDELKTNAVQTFKSRLGHGEDGSMFRTV